MAARLRRCSIDFTNTRGKRIDTGSGGRENFDLLMLATGYSHRLRASVSQRTPEPFGRSETEALQPPHTRRNLRRPNPERKQEADARSDSAEKAKADTHGNDDDRLQ